VGAGGEGEAEDEAMTRKELLAQFKYLLDHCEEFEVDLTRDAIDGPPYPSPPVAPVFITKVPSPNVDLRVTFRNVGKRHKPRQPAGRNQ
jgi:hypothetical protein